MALTKRLVLSIFVLCFSACGTDDRARKSKEIITFGVVSASTDTQEFLNSFGRYPESYENDVCYNITPEGIADKYGFSIFKFDQSCSSYVMYKNEIYPLGTWFGGYGVTSFAVTDLNRDGISELYYTYSWGSGMHRSLVGYFDPDKGEVHSFDYSNFNNDMILVNEDGKLLVYTGEDRLGIKSFVDITLTATNRVGVISFESKQIVFKA